MNFVGDLPTLYASTSLVDRVFGALGHFAIAGHVKDVYAEDRLVVHLRETLIGTGAFDLRTYLTRFENRYLFIEDTSSLSTYRKTWWHEQRLCLIRCLRKSESKLVMTRCTGTFSAGRVTHTRG